MKNLFFAQIKNIVTNLINLTHPRYVILNLFQDLSNVLSWKDPETSSG